jgi:hypothetical protein
MSLPNSAELFALHQALLNVSPIQMAESILMANFERRDDVAT